MTHTFSLLDVSSAAFEEIKQRLKLCGSQQRIVIQPPEGHEILLLGDIGLKRETDERVKVFILFEGKKL